MIMKRYINVTLAYFSLNIESNFKADLLLKVCILSVAVTTITFLYVV